MNTKMRKLLLDGDCLKAGIARGDVIVIVIPKQTTTNDKQMKKRSGILYGSTIFTDKQIIYFYKKHDGNASAASRELRMSLGGYKQRLAKLGLKPKGPGGKQRTYSEKEIYAAMKKTKNNAKAAARIIGCSYGTLKGRIARLGLKAKGVCGISNKKYSDKQIKTAMGKAGGNMSKAARILDCSYITMSVRVDKLGITRKRR